MRRLLALVFFLTGAIPCFGQAQWNGLQPQQNSSSPLQLRISDGDLSSILGTYRFSANNAQLVANATNYVYLDLSTSTPVLTVNQTGFPTTACYKIAIATTNATQITAVTDSRPSYNTTIGGGSGGTAANGTGGSTNPAGPAMGFYLTNACPVANTGQCFYTPANTKQDVTCTWTTSNANVVCTDSPFTAADVGKRAFGYITCTTDTATIASDAASGALTTGAVVTISTYTDANHVALSSTPQNASGSVTGIGPCFVYGAPDDSGAALLSTAVNSLTTAPTCPKVFLAAAYYMLTLPPAFMINQPPACNQLFSIYGGTQANLILAMGYEIEGRGTGPTVVWLTPGFPESGPGCVNGISNSSCFVAPLEHRWHDFSITGGNNSTAPNAHAGSNALMSAIGPGSLDNITMTNFGPNNTSFTCLRIEYWERLYQYNNSGCGAQGIDVAGASAWVQCIKCSIENSPAFDVLVETTNPVANEPAFDCFQCSFDAAYFSGPFNGPSVENFSGGLIVLTNSRFHTNVSAPVAYKAANTASSTLMARNVNFDAQFGSGTSQGSILCSIACNVYLEEVHLDAKSTGNPYADFTGSNLYDLGGNSGFTSGAGSTVAGINHHTETGTCTFATSTTCTVTFNRTFGTQGTPIFLIPPNIVGAATTLTVSALSATGATITASASNSSTVQWEAIQQ